MSSFMMPAAAGTCPVCAVVHKPELLHNAQSLAYQYAFYGHFGRWPNWWDASRHCELILTDRWFAEMRRQFPDHVKGENFAAPDGDPAEWTRRILAWEGSIKPGRPIQTPHLLKTTIVQIEHATAEADDE